jgi:lipopolysaccharide/colanic/teichoic acid biosynthesis glycosyltransferase
MPIFAYLAAVGSVLIALMFVTNATLEKGGPAIVTTQRVGLPEP